MQMDVDYDDENYDDDHDYDAPAESDLQYSDEMSRQAVGKLFAGGGKNDNASGPLVRGYRESASEKPARPVARPVRQVPASLDESGDAQMDRGREIRVVERGRPRRESATTRITQPESQNDVYKSGAREAARAAAANVRSRPIDQAGRQIEAQGAGGLNIEEPPRARPARGASPEAQAARPARQPAAPQEDNNLDFDGFRQRYNPGEMISPPRTKNRPVRGGQSPQREVRKDRVKISDRDLETINSFRLVIVGSCILVVALIGFLGFRVAVLAGQRNEAREQVDALAAAASDNIDLREQLEELRSDVASARNDASRYRNLLIAEGFELDGPVGEFFENGSGGGPQLGPGGTPPPRQPEVVYRPVIPPGGSREHFIEPSQSLASIAQIYWPHNPETPSGRLIRDQLIAHLVRTNNIPNPETIFAGQWLLIYEHPDIEQVFD